MYTHKTGLRLLKIYLICGIVIQIIHRNSFYSHHPYIYTLFLSVLQNIHTSLKLQVSKDSKMLSFVTVLFIVPFKSQEHCSLPIFIDDIFYLVNCSLLEK